MRLQVHRNNNSFYSGFDFYLVEIMKRKFRLGKTDFKWELVVATMSVIWIHTQQSNIRIINEHSVIVLRPIIFRLFGNNFIFGKFQIFLIRLISSRIEGST